MLPDSPPVCPPFFNVFAGAVPVGTIVAFAGKVDANLSPPLDGAPNTGNVEAMGWMICDGRSLQKNMFPELYSVMGILYGGDTNNFNIPDLRGRFLRGGLTTGSSSPTVGTNLGKAAGEGRTVANGGTDTGTGVGSRQEDALQDHAHTYEVASSTSAPSAPPPPPAAGVQQPAQTAVTKGLPNDSTVEKALSVKDSLYESRPVNIFVNYIIRFTYLTPAPPPAGMPLNGW